MSKEDKTIWKTGKRQLPVFSLQCSVFRKRLQKFERSKLKLNTEH